MEGFQSYRELIAKVDAQWRRSRKQLGERIRCAPGCSDCCRHISVFPVEAVRLALAVIELPGNRAAALRRRAAGADPDGACPLLDEDGRCALYEARPVICRTQGLPLLIGEEGNTRVCACPRNDFSQAPIPAGAIIGLERLNTLLATVNRLFVQRHLPGAPERLTVAAALEIEIQ